MFLFLLSVPEKELEALIPIEQVIAWRWAIVFAFSVPEVGTFVRAVRLCFFKSIQSFNWMEFAIVFGLETMHVAGLCLLMFKVLPELDVIQGAMLMNCFCFVPSVLCEFPSEN
jgi:chitin synthase